MRAEPRGAKRGVDEEFLPRPARNVHSEGAVEGTGRGADVVLHNVMMMLCTGRGTDVVQPVDARAVPHLPDRADAHRPWGQHRSLLAWQRADVLPVGDSVQATQPP